MTLDTTFATSTNPTLPETQSTEWKNHFNHGMNAICGVGLKAVGIASAGSMLVAAGPSAALAAGLVFGTTHVIGSLTKAQYEFEAKEDAVAVNPTLRRPDFVSIAASKLIAPL